jgi:hypothetical protein
LFSGAPTIRRPSSGIAMFQNLLNTASTPAVERALSGRRGARA